MSYAWSARPATDTDMTSVIDGRNHLITAADLDAGISRDQGHYQAICGATVVAAALASAPGPECAPCRRVVRTRQANRAAAHHRQRRAHWVPHALHRLRSTITSTPLP